MHPDRIKHTNNIPQYNFYKNKYGEELLIDVVELKYIRNYLKEKPVHYLTYYDITLITEGRGFFNINDKKNIVETGDIIFTHPGEIRQWDVLNIDSGYALIFEEEFLLTFFNDRNFLQNLSYFNLERNSVILKPEAGLYERILYLMQNIKTEIDHYQEKDKHILRALLYEVLTLLHRAYNSFSVTQNQNRHIQKFIRLVDNNFSKQHNVGYYADKLCLTPNYLNDIIKASIGVNAKVCIRNKIMNEAKKLLLYTSLSITEISEQLGYKETSYFIRFFKKHTRLTPLQYRLQKP